MSILHGSWISESNSFFIWGEAWRSLVNLKSKDEPTEIESNPFCLAEQELTTFLEEHNLNITAETQEVTIAIPSLKASQTKPLLPIFSKNLLSLETKELKKLRLHSWRITGLGLTSQEAIKFLPQLPLSGAEYLAPEVSFWTQLYRWVLDLIVKGKFISGIDTSGAEITGIWQPLLDGEIERTRLAKFSQLMPDICLSYQQNSEQKQELLLDFLTYILDAKVRTWLDYTPATANNITVNPWLRSLSETDMIIDTEPKNLQRLKNALYNWQLPLQEYIVSRDNNNLAQNRYRLALSLEPPIQDKKQEAQGNW